MLINYTIFVPNRAQIALSAPRRRTPVGISHLMFHLTVHHVDMHRSIALRPASDGHVTDYMLLGVVKGQLGDSFCSLPLNLATS